MTDTRAPSPTTGAGWGWIMAYGIVSVLAGLAAFVWPWIATVAATVAVGVAFLVSGLFSIAAGALGRGSESRGYAIVFGILSVVVGAVMAFNPVAGAVSLTLMVAIWLGARGVMELVFGVRTRRRRGLLIAMGVVNILLAAFIVLTVPFSALTLPGYLLGISFVFGGAAAIMAANDHRSGAPAFATPG
ncbi:HdeD family acid-resistance protein [Sphingomonas corticis]|jgi:uncharacterized membrane protein HdeD (DUF308 family)|uniref:HdeD family acid-resistance protein n=1 Tax=Sphingomonas corticis TaxID=2722791 RepID=A0ABX1CK00_9SPHN|nr:DUF308 domain-containing protein [Sphingomonas corticis]NJR78304.1 HdeD family acid-resistance protein [Sphingomonas corticis]